MPMAFQNTGSAPHHTITILNSKKKESQISPALSNILCFLEFFFPFADIILRWIQTFDGNMFLLCIIP